MNTKEERYVSIEHQKASSKFSLVRRLAVLLATSRPFPVDNWQSMRLLLSWVGRVRSPCLSVNISACRDYHFGARLRPVVLSSGRRTRLMVKLSQLGCLFKIGIKNNERLTLAEARKSALVVRLDALGVRDVGIPDDCRFNQLTHDFGRPDIA